MFTLKTTPTKLELADAWSKALQDITRETARRMDALGEDWLASDMSAIEKDRRRDAILAWERGQIEAEKVRWYDGLRALERAR